MSKVALTSVLAGPHTVKLVEHLIGHGREPVIVTEPSNARELKKILPPELQVEIVEIPSFLRLEEGVRALGQELASKKIKLSNWINTTDQTTAFFLKSCDVLGIEFRFRDAYERCRNKVATRTRLASTGVDDVSFAVHDINNRDLPRRFLFPFIAKPILGAGSKGVRIISGRDEWLTYLGEARRDLKSDDITLGKVRPGRQVLVEEMLAGQECQIDGFITHDRIEFCSIGLKTALYGRYGYRESYGTLYRPLALRESLVHDRRVLRWCEDVLRALNFKEGTFHVEAKINGPHLHLLEVNPRPGGGANVPEIKKLSGHDLNDWCASLWVGLPPPADTTPIYKSVSFAVRYPSRHGYVKSIRKSGRVSSVRGKFAGRLEWHGLVKVRDRLKLRGAEQYLGVLVGHDLCERLAEIRACSDKLLDLVSRPTFVRECGWKSARKSARRRQTAEEL